MTRSPTYVHRNRKLKNSEFSRLCSHLIASGTTYSAVSKFAELCVDNELNNHDISWQIPLPSRFPGPHSNDRYYVVGAPPSGFEPEPGQLSLSYEDDS